MNIMKYIIGWLLISFCLTSYANSQTYNKPHNATTLFVPTSFSKTNKELWDNLSQHILNSQYKVYDLKWYGIGGYTSMAKNFAATIKIARSQGKVIIISLIGTAYSSHAYAICGADRINFNGHKLMFHGPGNGDKPSKRYAYDPDNYVHSLFEVCVEKKLLQAQDEPYMYSDNGYEIYVSETKKWYRPDSRQTIK